MDYIRRLLAVITLNLATYFAQGLYPCEHPKSIDHGYSRYLRGGMLAQYFCHAGYQPFGTPMISCTRGSWMGEPPICVAPGCPPSAPPLHSDKIEKLRGAVIEHNCREGFELEGEAVIYCDGRQWSSSPPVCHGTGPSLIAPTPPFIIISPSSPLYPPDNAIEDPGNVTTAGAHPDRAKDVHEMGRPIFVGRSEKPPVFHPRFLKNMGSGGVLPLYKVPGADDEEEENSSNNHAAKISSQPNSPARERQRSPTTGIHTLNTNGQRSSILPPRTPQYRQYYMPNYSYGGMYPQYPYQMMYPRRAGYMPRYRQPIYSNRYITSGSSIRPVFLTPEVETTNTRGPVKHGSHQTQDAASDSTHRERQPRVYATGTKTNNGGSVQYPPSLMESNTGQSPRVFDKQEPSPVETRDRPRQEPVEGRSRAETGDAISDSRAPKASSPTEGEEESSERGMGCPPAKKPLQGYNTIRPLPRDYEGDEYLYLVEYHCLALLTLVGGNNIRYCTTKGRWTGTLPRCQKVQKCENGYTEQSPGRCVDANECAKNNGGCRYKCINSIGGFQCACHDGFRNDGSECVDLDECSSETENVCDQFCHNTPGSFRCSCRTGYRLRPGRGRRCHDVDECRDNSPCQHLCQNTPGSFRCACRNTFRLNEDRTTCSQVCQPGYVMQVDQVTNSKICADEDECMEHEGLGNCEQICNNTAGSYFCSCPSGYKLNVDGQTCIDVDECAEISTCEYGCINEVGSYSCSCPEDQVLSEDGLSCIGCQANSYMEGSNCVPCPENSMTENVGVKTRDECICRPGFKGSPKLGTPCADVDECQDENYGCSHNCANTPGSVFCDCPAGYTLDSDGKSCKDADECNERYGACGRGGICQNTEGGYNCTCVRGFRNNARNNGACEDINECQINNGGCQARCHNLQPGYRCSCFANWRLGRDGRSCVPLRGSCPPLKRLLNGRVLPEVPCVRLASVMMGRVCFHACNSGYKLVGNSRMQCGTEGWSSDAPECAPVSQCPPLNVTNGVRVIPPSCGLNSSFPWRMCVFACEDPTHMMKGSRSTRCIPNNRWEHRPPVCVSRKSNVAGATAIPRIQCPRDVDVDLAPGQSAAQVTVLKPVSNMNITVQRSDGNTSRDFFPAGTTSVRFTAFTSDGRRQAFCSVRVFVRDREAPTIQRCPGSISVESRQKFPEISWQAPLFRDNVAVSKVKESRHPPENITWGTYSVSYTASDAAGNMAECAFTVIIRRPKASRKQGVEACGEPRGPANGDASCHVWARGVYCVPRCHAGFAFERLPSTYVCDEEGRWTPGTVIPDCMDMRSAGQGHVVRPITTKAIVSTTATSMVTNPQTSLATEGNNSPSTSQSTMSKLRILERPTFYKVPLPNPEATPRPRKRPPLQPETSSIIHRGVSQPRLVKLLPETTDCPRGHVPEIDDEGRETCVECPRGYYRPRVASSVRCRPCLPGFYQDRPGKGYCNRCPNYVPGTYSSTMPGSEELTGLTSIKQCRRIETLTGRNARSTDVKMGLARGRRRLLRHR